jgi:hypothetical protein
MGFCQAHDSNGHQDDRYLTIPRHPELVSG